GRTRIEAARAFDANPIRWKVRAAVDQAARPPLAGLAMTEIHPFGTSGDADAQVAAMALGCSFHAPIVQGRSPEFLYRCRMGSIDAGHPRGARTNPTRSAMPLPMPSGATPRLSTGSFSRFPQNEG